MTRILVAVVTALLLTNSSMAQSYCDQVRQAVATYGYAAAKRHAMATYSKREVEVADRCVRGSTRSKRKARIWSDASWLSRPPRHGPAVSSSLPWQLSR